MYLAYQPAKGYHFHLDILSSNKSNKKTKSIFNYLYKTRFMQYSCGKPISAVAEFLDISQNNRGEKFETVAFKRNWHTCLWTVQICMKLTTKGFHPLQNYFIPEYQNVHWINCRSHMKHRLHQLFQWLQLTTDNLSNIPANINPASTYDKLHYVLILPQKANRKG